MPLDLIQPQQPRDPFAEFNASPHAQCLFPVALRKTAWERRDGTYETLPGNRTIIRTSPDFSEAWPLAVVSSTYRLVPNKELLGAVEDTFRQVLPSSQIQDVQITDRISNRGRQSYRTYVFPSITCDIGAKSPIAFRTVVQNAYGTTSLRIMSGAIEFWCANGIVRGEYEQSYHRHTSGLSMPRIQHLVQHSVDRFWDTADTYRKWCTQPVTVQQTMEMFQKIATTPSLYDKLISQWAVEREHRGSTVWSAYSAMTYYASHNSGEFALRMINHEAEARNMVQREIAVSKWLKTPAWQEFVTA